ncbi:spore coat protein [Desertibacillus haloalkaliphilus]|uniref:spore coat protein n=1 Tax=Desertibacillus haloalkaliphilus TaxID=1328930 RepID=UPI001C275CF4|nr:spore coat protein [Desertibacillus haloalkaliphilus]MBU8907890.1 spore coat protein [Desertibacillus haloalkaliphilus]
MNQLIEKVTGMAPLTDQVIATDMLMAAKSAIKNYALAITEAATPEVRQTLIKHLEDEIDFHRKISNYMIEQGYYNPHDTAKQLQVDLSTANAALQH